jgi:hypothetical protein
MISHIGWDNLPHIISRVCTPSEFRFKVSDMCVRVYAFFGVTLGKLLGDRLLGDAGLSQ